MSLKKKLIRFRFGFFWG